MKNKEGLKINDYIENLESELKLYDILFILCQESLISFMRDIAELESIIQIIKEMKKGGEINEVKKTNINVLPS